ncbi:hypothetical protein Cfor_12492, partial [Coptotermes formosanus]
VRSNRRLTLREVAEEVNISKTVCHEIRTDNLGMHGGKNDGCCNMTTREHTHRSLSVTFWPNMRRLSFRSFRTRQTSPRPKSTLKGRRFESIEAIKANSLAELRSVPNEAFQECFKTLKKRWQQCMQSRGEYFEGDKAE